MRMTVQVYRSLRWKDDAIVAAKPDTSRHNAGIKIAPRSNGQSIRQRARAESCSGIPKRSGSAEPNVTIKLKLRQKFNLKVGRMGRSSYSILSSQHDERRYIARQSVNNNDIL